MSVKYFSNLKVVAGKIVRGLQRLKWIVETLEARGGERIDADEIKPRGAA